MDNSQPNKRIKLRYKILVAVILLIAGLITAYFINRQSELDKKFDEIRAAGFPVTLQELNVWYSVPAGEENAADIYDAAFAAYNTANVTDEMPVVGDAVDPKRGERMSPELIKQIQVYLDDNKETLELLKEAAAIEHCEYPVNYMQGLTFTIPHVGEVKNCAKLLNLKAMVDAEEDRGDMFIEDIETAVKLAGSLDNEPILISFLVRTACVALTLGSCEYAVNRVEFEDGQLVQLISIFTQAENSELIVNALAGERTMIADFILNPSTYSGVSGAPPVGINLYSAIGLNKSGLLAYLDFCEDNIEALKLPMHERVAAMKLAEEQIFELPWYHNVVKEFLPALTRVAEVDLRYIANIRACRMGLAVERYRLAEGKLPEKLDDLVPAYIKSVEVDPFDGKPIRYKKLEKGYVVYSVGEDLADNGGKEKDNKNRKAEYDLTFTVERQGGNSQ